MTWQERPHHVEGHENRHFAGAAVPSCRHLQCHAVINPQNSRPQLRGGGRPAAHVSSCGGRKGAECPPRRGHAALHCPPHPHIPPGQHGQYLIMPSTPHLLVPCPPVLHMAGSSVLWVCYRLSYVPPSSYTGALTPSTSGCDCVGRQGLTEVTGGMGSPGWACPQQLSPRGEQSRARTRTGHDH